MNVLVFVLPAVRIRSKAVWSLPASSETYNLLWSGFRPDCIADVSEEFGTPAARSRRTQTNVPERCATLLPLLARLPQPLALLEVGASAGLCLLPDYYAYPV